MKKTFIFAALIIAQFCGTSLWFAGNVVLPQLQQEFHWQPSALGYLTSSIQLGFISGTLCFSILGLADRFSSSKLFFVSSVIAAACNLLALADLSSYPLLLTSRFLTGFFLAGIYPVGMKIAADWKQEGLGNWLGALVGALVLGTAFPHALKLFPQFLKAQALLLGVTSLALLGGLLIILVVPDGPYRKRGSQFSLHGLQQVFKINAFRAPAFGYFGHMWELYTLWAFVPWIINHYKVIHPSFVVHSSLIAFLVIGAGGIGCMLGGLLSVNKGSAWVARNALICSGLCCIMSPWLWNFSPAWFTTFMILWGVTVAADSPQFSALVAQHAPAQVKGSAITLIVCIGFTITIASVQLLNHLQYSFPGKYLLLLLAPGPIAGIFAMRRANSIGVQY
ncbi:MAG: MFS transporter [Bacteroidota bacterium]